MGVREGITVFFFVSDTQFTASAPVSFWSELAIFYFLFKKQLISAQKDNIYFFFKYELAAF